MNHLRFLFVVSLLAGLTFGLAAPVQAQENLPGTLTISTAYPSQVVGIGETVTLSMEVYSPSAQTVNLEVADLPSGWKAEFRGGGRVIQAVYVAAGSPSKVDLRITPSLSAIGGAHQITALARGIGVTAEFPIKLIVQDKVPAQLAFETEFPTIRGGSDSIFRFSLDLRNDGDEDIAVTLTADAPREFMVRFKSSGKDITNLPTDVPAGSTEKIDIEAEALTTLEVGSYPINVLAQGENVEASIALAAEVVGQPQLTLTTPDGRLSGEAVLGRSNPITLVLRNAGNSPAIGVKLSVTSPAGWTVTMDPEEVIEVPAGGEVEVTAHIEPAEKAIAGDYMLTFRAQPNESAAKSADFRVTVETSTLWGLAGIASIAVALGIVGLAVTRFGRR